MSKLSHEERLVKIVPIVWKVPSYTWASISLNWVQNIKRYPLFHLFVVCTSCLFSQKRPCRFQLAQCIWNKSHTMLSGLFHIQLFILSLVTAALITSLRCCVVYSFDGGCRSKANRSETVMVVVESFMQWNCSTICWHLPKWTALFF